MSGLLAKAKSFMSKIVTPDSENNPHNSAKSDNVGTAEYQNKKSTIKRSRVQC